MANIAIFRINYKSDFILTLNSDAGWLTPFCIKFWTGAPSQAYFVGFDGTTYTHCAPVAGDSTKLLVQFDDHHLPIGDLKFQIGYHFTVADFPTSVEDEVLNQASVIIEVNDAPAQVMLDLNGETAPEIEFNLPAFANEAQRIENEQQRIENEQQRIDNEQQRIGNEQTRQRNEETRIENEQNRVLEFGQMKGDLEQATRYAAAAAENANEKGIYAKNQGDYAKQQGDYAKQQGDTAQADHERAEEDHRIAGEDHTQAGNDHTRAGEDHTQAGSDHTRAGEDHTRAGDDHTRADQDHTNVQNAISEAELVFDISKEHAEGGVLATYANLSAALGVDGANIPANRRKGGMTVQFVQSSDNKYVQFRLIKNTWSTNTSDWALYNEDVLVENPEFISVKTDKDGRILWAIKTDGSIHWGAGVPQQVIDYVAEKISELSLDEYEDIVAFLGNLITGDKTLQDLLDEKVDNVEGESLIDEDFANGISYVENPEFIKVWLDNENKILFGIKSDGDIMFGCGVPSQVVTYISDKIAELHLTDVSDIITFLGDLYTGDETLQQLLDKKVDGEYIENPEFVRVITDNEDKVLEGIKVDGTKVIGSNLEVKGTVNGVDVEDVANKVDKVEGKSLINSEYASSMSVIENPEYINVELDSEEKILGGRKTDGTKFENVALEVGGHTLKNIEDLEERTEAILDSEDKIISYRKADGTLVENVGIETSSANIEEVEISGGTATLESASVETLNTESLNLTEQGMTDFQQALKDSGFRQGGSGNYSDKESMYIPIPRLAHLNITTDFVLTSITRTSNIPVIIEFFDGTGVYFKKYGILNGQGRSSMSFLKKGLSLDFFNEDPDASDFDEDNVFEMKFGDWVYQDSFHLKSFYTDWPRCTTPVVYQLTDEVMRTHGVMSDRPYKKYYVGNYTFDASSNNEDSLKENMETGARCVPDGFPVIIYQNGTFWGVNSWQLKKHRDNYQLNKKKAKNIHLDGDMGTTKGQTTAFWLYNGTIDWTAFCSGTGGIETRNPKNLYCIDGKKYDADTHDLEIIDTATAESWIASGTITPTGKVIDEELAGYLRTTGQVRSYIEALTTYIPYINGLANGTELIEGQQATTAQIKAAIEERFDVSTFIDYILLGNVTGNNDAWDNNGQIITWGSVGESQLLNWSVNVYDCDITFGCRWDGLSASAPNTSKLGSNYPLYKIFWDYYATELQTRYHELRDAKIFDAEHITKLFRDWIDRVGYDNYDKEYKKWDESPCFRDGSETYTNYPTTGGFYGSIYRIYLWIKKRIEYMDAQDFFNYNQN